MNDSKEVFVYQTSINKAAIVDDRYLQQSTDFCNRLGAIVITFNAFGKVIMHFNQDF